LYVVGADLEKIMSEEEVLDNPDMLLSTLAGLFAAEDRRKEVAFLATSQLVIRRDQTGYGGRGGIVQHKASVFVTMPAQAYAVLDIMDRELLERELFEKCKEALSPYPTLVLKSVKIAPGLLPDDEWRKKAMDWLIRSEKPKALADKRSAST
jgi:hypothetical protein